MARTRGNHPCTRSKGLSSIGTTHRLVDMFSTQRHRSVGEFGPYSALNVARISHLWTSEKFAEEGGKRRCISEGREAGERGGTRAFRYYRAPAASGPPRRPTDVQLVVRQLAYSGLSLQFFRGNESHAGASRRVGSVSRGLGFAGSNGDMESADHGR